MTIDLVKDLIEAFRRLDADGTQDFTDGFEARLEDRKPDFTGE